MRPLLNVHLQDTEHGQDGITADFECIHILFKRNGDTRSFLMKIVDCNNKSTTSYRELKVQIDITYMNHYILNMSYMLPSTDL